MWRRRVVRQERARRVKSTRRPSRMPLGVRDHSTPPRRSRSQRRRSRSPNEPGRRPAQRPAPRRTHSRTPAFAHRCPRTCGRPSLTHRAGHDRPPVRGWYDLVVVRSECGRSKHALRTRRTPDRGARSRSGFACRTCNRGNRTRDGTWARLCDGRSAVQTRRRESR